MLITAAIGIDPLSAVAVGILSDTSREFVSSDWVKLEVLPKAQYFKRKSEVAFYDPFFSRISIWVAFQPDLLTRAMVEATNNGLSAVDAIHVVSAARVECNELITTERPNSAIHRSQLLKIVLLNVFE